MTTPFSIALESELNAEWPRFANEWLFRWHNLTIENRVVDVETFSGGGRFHLGGIRFEGQPQQLFWQSIGRYLNQKIHSVFKQWDDDTSSYPDQLRLDSLTDVETLLTHFASQIIAQATDTDRRLRGHGAPQSISPYDSSGYQSSANATIARLVEAHRSLISEKIKQNRPATGRPTTLKRVELFHANHKGLLYFLVLLGSIGMGLLKYFL